MPNCSNRPIRDFVPPIAQPSRYDQEAGTHVILRQTTGEYTEKKVLTAQCIARCDGTKCHQAQGPSIPGLGHIPTSPRITWTARNSSNPG